MSKTNKIIVGVAAVAIAALLIDITRKHKREKVLRIASEEGYETAQDVLFPEHTTSKHLKYGPVFSQ
jgi:HD superfamily phosphohydrolase YqeK